MAPGHAWSFRYLYLRLYAFGINSFVWPIVSILILKDRYYPNVEGIQYSEMRIASRDPKRKIKVIVHTPKTLKAGEPSPVIVNTHGGGFVLHVHGSDIQYLRWMSKELNCIYLDVNYRKSPHNVFPAAIEDVEDVLAHVYAHPDIYDQRRIAMSGFSAGATIALGASIGQEPGRISSIVTLYPACDFEDPLEELLPPNKELYAKEMLNADLCNKIREMYILKKDRSDPRATLWKAKADTFPPHVFVAAGEGDIVYSHGKKLITELQAASHPDAVFVSVPDVGHAFDRQEPHYDQRDRIYSLMADTFRRGWKIEEQHTEAPTTAVTKN